MLPGDSADDAARENSRLARRVKRLEMTLEHVEQIRDINATLLDRLMRDLDLERTRSRELLLNTLPATIVDRLEAGETKIADGHPVVGVLMADLVGFTNTASRLSPTDLVGDLNTLFTRFDEACTLRGVEKIKTIGDAYMAVGGLDADEAAIHGAIVAVAELALDMVDQLRAADLGWSMRVGVHAGPVVSGIIGSRKFAFDVWGDTVNVASRLEATSQPDRVQISSAVHEILERAGGFEVEPRGEIELKGKGLVETWFLNGRWSHSPDGSRI